VQHLASASFADWPEFGKLCGRYWVMGKSGHGPRVPFESKIADAAHPITAGLAAFTTDDELYAKLCGDGPIHVLVTADSPWSKKTEPLVFCLDYGQGRVVHNAYGHDGKALQTPEVQKIIARGVEWAATGKVSGE
jgi:type 1 glutamine amidotransferase